MAIAVTPIYTFNVFTSIFLCDDSTASSSFMSTVAARKGYYPNVFLANRHISEHFYLFISEKVYKHKATLEKRFDLLD